MNNKGFTMMEVLAAIVIVSVILMVVYPSVSEISKKNNEDKYHNYEKMMVEYAMINKNRDKDILKLVKYAKKLDIEDEVVELMEVLL